MDIHYLRLDRIESRSANSGELTRIGAGPHFQRLVRKLFQLRFDEKHFETAGLIVCNGGRVVEVAGMHPDALRAHVPCSVDGGGEERSAELFANEGGKQTEVHDFYVAVSLSFQLEIPGGCTRYVCDPRFKIGAVEVSEPFGFAPGSSAIPAPVGADGRCRERG